MDHQIVAVYCIFHRRLHRMRDRFLTVFALRAEHWKALNSESLYMIDSFPVTRCDTSRITRSRRSRGPAYHGYIASKRRYRYGLRLPLVVTPTGQPVAVWLLPGADHDTGARQWYQFDLAAGATMVGDNAFNHSGMEDDLAAVGLSLAPLRTKHSKRAVPPWTTYGRQSVRQYSETVGSTRTHRFPQTIHALPAAGFKLKVVVFVLAYSIDCL